jgi:hypothetical protein
MAQEWRIIRVPADLGCRLDKLKDQMQAAYSEGRRTVPNALVEAIPIWYVIQTLCDEVESRRARSNRPRRRPNQEVSPP